MAKRFKISELVVGVKADIRNFKIGLRQGVSELRGFARTTGAISREMRGVTASLGVFTAASVGAGIKAVKVFADLQQAIANTASVTGGTTEEVQELEAFARKMGKTTIFTATQAADAMYYLGSAGYEAREIFDSLEGILSLAAATQYDLAETTATVVSTLRAFSLEADQASRISNVFAAAISSSQATMFKLQQSMKYIAPVAANLNYSIEDTTAALSLLYNSGLEASMSGTQLRMALTRLQKPTAQSIQAMKAMGLEMEDLDPAFNSLVDIIENLEKANSGAATSGSNMAKIFGVRAVNAMNILVRNGSTALKAMTESITGTNKALSMQQRQIDTLRGTWRLMTSAMQETAAIIGTNLEPMLRALMESVRQLNLWFADMHPILRQNIVNTGVFVTAISGLLSILGGLGLILPKIGGGLKSVGMVFSRFGGIIFSIVAAVAALISAFVWLTSAQERHQRQMKSALLDYDNYLSGRKKDLTQTKTLIDSLKKLSKEEKLNETQIKRRNKELEKLAELHPKVIDGEKSLESQMQNINEVYEENQDKLDKIIAKEKRLNKLRKDNQIAVLQKEIDDLNNSLEDYSIDKKIGDIFDQFVSGEGLFGKESMSQFKSDLNEVDEGLADMVLKTKVGSDRLGAWSPNMNAFKSVIGEIAKDEDQINRLNEIRNKLYEKQFKRRIEYNDLLEEASVWEETSGKVFPLSSELEQKKQIYKIERELYNAMTEVLNVIEKRNEKQLKLNKLKEETKEKTDEEKEAERELSSQERSDALALAKLEHQLAIAGMNDRIELRKRELEMWRKSMINQLQDMGRTREQAEHEVSEAVSRKRIENAEKTKNEILAFEMALMMKGASNEYDIRRKELEKWKRDNLKEAEALHQDRNKVIEKYEKELTQIKAEEERARRDLLASILSETENKRTDTIRDAYKREKAIEEQNYEEALLKLEQYKERMQQEVKKGMIAETTLMEKYNAQKTYIKEEHNQKMIDLEREYQNEKRDIQNQLAVEGMQAEMAIAQMTPFRAALEKEKIAYKQRKNELESWLNDKLDLVSKGKLEETEVIETYNKKQRAASIEHENRKKEIRFEFENEERKMKLERIDDDKALYDEQLREYIDWLNEKIANTEEYNDLYFKRLKERDDAEEELLDRDKRRNKEKAKFVTQTMDLITTATRKAAEGNTAAWKEAFSQFISMAAGAIKSWVKAQIAVSWANPVALAGWSAAYMAVSAAERVALHNIQRAAYGAKVNRTGLAEVHEGETIVPANLNESAILQRMPWQEYMKNIAPNVNMPDVRDNYVGAKQERIIEERRNIVDIKINTDGIVVAPSGSDEADDFYKRFIVPAEKRLRESLGE